MKQEQIDWVAEYEAMLEQGATAFFAEQVYQDLIDFYLESEQPERAMEVAERALVHYRFSPDFFIRKAELLLHAHQEGEALEVLAEAAILAPNHLEIFLLKAQAQATLGNISAAEMTLNEASHLAGRGDQGAIFYVQAYVAECQGNIEAMYGALKQAIHYFPTDREVFEKLWNGIHSLKRYEESIELHNELIDRDPYSSLAWFNLGQTQACLGNYDLALEAFEFALLIDASFEVAHRERAELLFELQQYAEALEAYREMLELFPADWEWHLRIGQCLLAQGQPLAARQDLLAAKALEPFQDEVLFHLGETYLAEEKWRPAIAFFEQALKIDNGREEYHARLALALSAINQAESALYHYFQAVEIAPEDPQYWEQYVEALLRCDDPVEALEVLEQAEEFTTSAELVYLRVAALFAARQRQSALQALAEALEDDFSAHELLLRLQPELLADQNVVSLIHAYR